MKREEDDDEVGKRRGEEKEQQRGGEKETAKESKKKNTGRRKRTDAGVHLARGIKSTRTLSNAHRHHISLLFLVQPMLPRFLCE